MAQMCQLIYLNIQLLIILNLTLVAYALKNAYIWDKGLRDFQSEMMGKVILHLVSEKPFVYLSTTNSLLTVREKVDQIVDFGIDYNAYPEPQYFWQKGKENITEKDKRIEAWKL
jgi:hypothetical protein